LKLKIQTLALVFIMIATLSACSKKTSIEVNINKDGESKVDIGSEEKKENNKADGEKNLDSQKGKDSKSESNKKENIENKLNAKGSLAGKVICIDPGHGISSSKKQEPMAPDSSIMKPGYVSGAEGKTQTEEELNLEVALKLRDSLSDLGATVYMTRETHETELSNVGRAKFANEKNADMVVRLHADGIDDKSVYGISMLVPSSENLKNSQIVSESKIAGQEVLSQVVKYTQGKGRGVVERSDMTGFNWSEVPVILLEMGFLTNDEEDARLSKDTYQDSIVKGVASGLENYFQSK
jgi:N-acetylmuramoyl-L-alanine amidase